MRVLLFLFLAIFSLNANYNCENCENLDPNKVQKVYASNPVILYQLYAVDKSKAAGLVFEFWDIEKEFLDENFTNLPVVGGFFGQGRTPNIEQVLALRPDLILASTNTTELYQNIFKKTKIPVLYLDALTIEDSLNSFEILGEFLDASNRAKNLKISP
ncbi:ABC transporter substrate-binding protein [Campylobacter corcagiensis]|uniref:ABC transporter substrate-binding protein n=1 Tax=Campylobacter corcagiensis TaxID=1448857 RepID=A0A7M1LJ73_9BACT|nr:ABC transporter substrate-binding protein [Campylobacter corcagiensis]QOQ87974.1 ABC transporter substrate-binding protein [Campylobacter corcagiensis]